MASSGVYVVVVVLAVLATAVMSWHVPHIKLPHIKLPHLPHINLPHIKLPSRTSVDVNDLEWSSCGGPADLIQINSITIDPIPLHLPGKINIGFDFTVRRNITGPISADMDAQWKLSKLIGWQNVGCVDHEGACPSDDVYSQTKCEAHLSEHGVDCKTLTNEGRHVLPKTTINVDKIKLPSFLTKAEYRGKMTFKNAGKPVACLRASFKLG